MTELSDFEEMYLKRMFEIHSEQPSAIVKTSMLAESMGVSNASTTEMIQRLAGRDLVTYIPYKGSRLTAEGFAIAGKIKRRQLLLELLLTDIIGFEGDVNSLACEMEHAVTDELESSIDRLLGYPEYTHSGERVPQISRQFQPEVKSPLLPISNMPEGSNGVVEFIALSGQDIKTLENQQISVGEHISKTPTSINVGENPVLISDTLAKRILVRLEE
ncbi:MAG: metal-dependent transcriptional regulator [Candidatus Thermoplasmatota archaeon]|nr:metal-dependent transcriptional regulator [Candidatus Thermoplasmatota archaeon]